MRNVQFLGHVINKDDIIVLECFRVYSMNIEILHEDSGPLYDLIQNDTIFKWTPEHKLFSEGLSGRFNRKV